MNRAKWIWMGFGWTLAVAHIGIIGHMIKLANNQLPIINLPVGNYTSYTVEAGKDGYRINYQANDPKVMSVDKDIQKKNGFFGIGGSTDVKQSEQYTMDGSRHLQGGQGLGKLSAEKLECIKSAGAGESTGRMVGASVGAGIAPVFTSIPYVGWLMAGWAVMLGQDTGAEVGGEIATMAKGCDIEEIKESK